MMKPHNTSFYKCVLCVCNNCDCENRNGFLIHHQWAKHENEILIKHLNSVIKIDLGDGTDSCHVTLVSDDGEQLINKSLLHIVHLTIWWNISEKWAMYGNRAYVLQKRKWGHLYPVHLYGAGGQRGDWLAEGAVGGHSARSPWGQDRVYGYD